LFRRPYDKGNYSDGWRFLEAAPGSTEWVMKDWGGIPSKRPHWRPHGNKDYEIGTETGAGTGATNTERIVQKLGDGDYAAKLCADLKFGGYEDWWFLPSVDEHREMFEN
jgi:hypothetical protein